MTSQPSRQNNQDLDVIHGHGIPWSERAAPDNSRIFWMTTAPNPSSPATGYDAGRRGWKLHAVVVGPGEDELANAGLIPSLCGRHPTHGWDIDLFVTDPCSRCRAAARALGAYQERATGRFDDVSPATMVVVPIDRNATGSAEVGQS